MAFDMTTITVPAGAAVTMNFSNKDVVPHDFALYTDSTAVTVIYKSDTVAGSSSKTYTFNAPTTPGTYYFRCDIHPLAMKGSFVVTAN